MHLSLLDFLFDFCPELQLMQPLWPSLPCENPDGQPIQLTPEALLNFPTSQSKHSVILGLGCAVPDSHRVQLRASFFALIHPSGHIEPVDQIKKKQQIKINKSKVNNNKYRSR